MRLRPGSGWSWRCGITAPRWTRASSNPCSNPTPDRAPGEDVALASTSCGASPSAGAAGPGQPIGRMTAGAAPPAGTRFTCSCRPGRAARRARAAAEQLKVNLGLFPFPRPLPVPPVGHGHVLNAGLLVVRLGVELDQVVNLLRHGGVYLEPEAPGLLYIYRIVVRPGARSEMRGDVLDPALLPALVFQQHGDGGLYLPLGLGGDVGQDIGLVIDPVGALPFQDGED